MYIFNNDFFYIFMLQIFGQGSFSREIMCRFFAVDELYQALEKSWQEDTGETSSFGQHCGRLPGPHYSTKPLSTEQKGKGHRRHSWTTEREYTWLSNYP